MGRSTDCDVVKFGVSCLACFDMYSSPSLDVLFFTSPELYAEGKYEDVGEDEFEELYKKLIDGETTLKGWAVSDEAVTIGKKGNLYANKFVKGEHEVFFINESSHASGGSIVLTVVANDKKSLKKFMKSHGDIFPNGKGREIEKSIAVQQTL